jgi:hypothetical protein
MSSAVCKLLKMEGPRGDVLVYKGDMAGIKVR